MTSGAPDMTLEELLEQLLPHCHDDPFEVAKWLDGRIRKKSGVVLLADEIPVSPEIYSGHLKVEAKIASNGKSALQVLVLRPFGHAERVEAIAGYRQVMNEKGKPKKDEHGWPVMEPIMRPYERSVGPIKQWTIERKSFEANRSDASRNRGGRPDKYPHMHIVRGALIYVAVNGAPAKLDGEGGLFEKLEAVLEPADTPERGTLYKIFNPIWKRIENERKRIEEERKKSKKKPGQ